MGREEMLQHVDPECIEVADRNVSTADLETEGYIRLVYGQLTVHVYTQLPNDFDEAEIETTLLHWVLQNGYNEFEAFDYDEFESESDADLYKHVKHRQSYDARSTDLSPRVRAALDAPETMGYTQVHALVTLGAKYSVPMSWSDTEIEETMIALVLKHGRGTIHDWDITEISDEYDEHFVSGDVDPVDHYMPDPDDPRSNDDYIF